MKKLIEEQNIEREGKSKGVVLALLAVAFFLLATQVFIANALVEATDRLRVLDRETAELESKNETMAEEVRSRESLTSLEDQARMAGFVKTDKVIFLEKNASPVAFREGLTVR